MNRMNGLALAALVSAASVCATARADTLFWVGAGATTNWSNVNNWYGLNRPDDNGQDDVYMDGAYQHSTNTVNQDYWVNRLVFDVEDGRENDWTINQSNNAVLSIATGIGNSTSKTQTVNVPIRLTNDIYIGNNGTGSANNGLLNIGNVNLDGHDLSLYPSASGINITGTITGSGNLRVEASGWVSLSGSNNWTGYLVIRQGSVIANAGVNLGSISNRVVFDQSSANSIPTLVRNSSGTIAIPITFDSGEGRIETPSGVSVTLASGLDGKVNGGSFAKTGLGTVVLTAPAIKYYQTIVRAGTLQLAADMALSTDGAQVLNGATLSINPGVSQVLQSVNGFGSIQLGNSSTFTIGKSGDPTSTSNGTGTFGGTISGSSLVVKQGAGTFTLSGNSTYAGITDVRGGVLVANNSAANTSATGTSTVTVKAGTRLAGDGVISGPVFIDNAAQIAPSNVGSPDAGIGTLGTGSLTLFGGAVTRIEYNATSIDRINVIGTAIVDGTLDLTRFGGGTGLPGMGTARQILSTTGGRNGVFASVGGVSLDADTSWAVTYSSDGIFATIASPGDLNLDRTVNFDDLLALAQSYGTAGVKTWATGDLTGDGTAGFDDLLLVAQRYGSSSVAASAALDFAADWALARSMVPEPTLLAASLLLGVFPQSRRARA